MDKLWVRLSVAFAVLTLLSVLIVGLLANNRVSTEFQRYFVVSQVQESGLVDALGRYYGENGGWAGVESVIEAAPTGGPGMGQGMGMMRGMRWGAGGLTLADTDRRVVYSTGGAEVGATLPGDDPASATLPVTSQGTTVGYLQATSPGHMNMSASAQGFLSRINATLVQAGLIAGAAGIALGVLIAWIIATPLKRLDVAARDIARGRFDHRVQVPSRALVSEEIADLAGSFNEMAGSLQKAEQLRHDMVADIAHDLRTPLAVVQGNLQAILDGVYPLDRQEIATIHEQTLVLSRLVDDLRELAQAEAGQLDLRIQPLDPAVLVESVVGVYRETAFARGVELALETVPGVPMALADADRVRQVLHNLLTNALRYTPTGGRITVSTHPAGMDPGSIVVSVTDTGPGIPPDALAHVFDRFWRGDKARSRAGDSHVSSAGSGLGLAIARQLVEAQGGTIGVESEPGRGTRFWFTLPASRGAALPLSASTVHR
jgi:two-component system OmpR family sensor kinase/two-component system sensor histidine kinase BaeS